MADITRTATATWSGDLRSGKGMTSTGGGGLRDLNYSFHRSKPGQAQTPKN